MWCRVVEAVQFACVQHAGVGFTELNIVVGGQLGHDERALTDSLESFSAGRIG
jgi:hypothetical protein